MNKNFSNMQDLYVINIPQLIRSINRRMCTIYNKEMKNIDEHRKNISTLDLYFASLCFLLQRGYICTLCKVIKHKLEKKTMGTLYYNFHSKE